MPLERTLRHLTALYDARADPWDHLTSAYEREKYARTLAALGDRTFAHGLEVGCGIGALTALLAPRCARLTAIDCVPAALSQARARLAGLDGIELIEGCAPTDLPAISPDLVVLSEVLYFMTPAEIDALARWIEAHATSDALVVVVSWRGDTGEAFSGPDASNRLARGLPGWDRERAARGEYEILVLARSP